MGVVAHRLARAVVTYLCPKCGTTRPPDEVTCAFCGFDIRAFENATFDEKLMVALFHPEPETSERAAFLLGVRGPARNVAPAAESLIEAHLSHKRD